MIHKTCKNCFYDIEEYVAHMLRHLNQYSLNINILKVDSSSKYLASV